MLRRSTDDGMTPTITIGHVTPIKEMVGFRSTRIGKLQNAVDDVIYTNVYFDFMGDGFPGSSTNREIENSLDIPSTKVLLYKRENIFRLRTLLIETDSPLTITNADGNSVQEERAWRIEEIDHSGNFMVLTLREAKLD